MGAGWGAGAGCGVQVALASSQQLPAHGSSLSQPAPWGHAAPMSNAHHRTGTSACATPGPGTRRPHAPAHAKLTGPQRAPAAAKSPSAFRVHLPPTQLCWPTPVLLGGPDPQAPSAPRPCWALSGPALSQGRCCSSPKGPEVCRDPTSDSGVTWGTAPQLGRLGDSAKVTEPARGEGRPLIFLTPNKPSLPTEEREPGAWPRLAGAGGTRWPSRRGAARSQAPSRDGAGVQWVLTDFGQILPAEQSPALRGVNAPQPDPATRSRGRMQPPMRAKLSGVAEPHGSPGTSHRAPSAGAQHRGRR